MAGKIKFSFHHRVLLALLAMCWFLIGVSLIFQYHRERKFRHEILDTRLQMYNTYIIDQLDKNIAPLNISQKIKTPWPDLRITIINQNGNVVFDNINIPTPMSNHNDRPEIIAARKSGKGYSVERKSESDHTYYFYSATAGPNGIIIRSAAPYTHSLQDFLKADSSFLWIMTLLTSIVSLAGYLITRKISTSIHRLNNFAEKAEKGEHIFNDWNFPHDELGSIASHIVRLYVQRDQQMQATLNQEKDKIRLKKQLTNNINHELKTPVASILLCSELINDHPDLPESKRTEFMARIYSNARRLSVLMNDIASITRMDDGAEMIDKTSIDVKSLITEIVEQEQIRTHMRIHIEMPELTIQGNHALLDSIFRNLIDNSITHSKGSDIWISADELGNFSFKDNGTGIPEQHIPHIFERFYRIDTGRTRATGGTGLGLAIVRNAVAIHGGKITVCNDCGLRFEFHLG